MARKGWSVRNIWQRLKAKGVRYWFFAAVIFLLTAVLSPHLYDYLKLSDARARFFQSLLDWGPWPPQPKFVKLVLIEDDEYYGDRLAGRKPLKRDYLAELVEKLAAMNARVIALDFDVRLPNRASLEIPESYREETDALIRAIVRAAERGRKIVLSTVISFDPAHSEAVYRTDSDIYQARGLCPFSRPGPANAAPLPVLSDNVRKNIACGYIALPRDRLSVPPSLPMSDGGSLDSFAFSLARLERPDLAPGLSRQLAGQKRYINYISFEKFQEANAVFSADALLGGKIAPDALDGRIVIVGANWSRDAAGRGAKIDLHWTPAGEIVGAALHANYAEALLDRRIVTGAPDWLLEVSEMVLSLLAAIVFALIAGLFAKIATLLASLAAVLLLQWALLHGFGVFFDAFVPLLGLGLHSVIERLAAGADHD